MNCWKVRRRFHLDGEFIKNKVSLTKTVAFRTARNRTEYNFQHLSKAYVKKNERKKGKRGSEN